MHSLTMEQKMSQMLTTFTLVIFCSITLADDKNGIPYDDCKWLECVGIKDDKGDCVDSKKCDILLIRSTHYSQQVKLVAHRLYWKKDSQAGPGYPYAAAAYSKDAKIEDAAVTVCTQFPASLALATGLSKNGGLRQTRSKSGDLVMVSKLYVTKSNEVNVCAWTTEITFSKNYSVQEATFTVTTDLSQEQYILLGKGTTEDEIQITKLSLQLLPDKTFKFDPVACDSQAYIFESFYCWKEEALQNGWTLYTTIHSKGEARFQVSFTNKQLDQTMGSISVGLSLHPLSKSISLVKCSWNDKTVSIQEAFDSKEDKKDLAADKPIAYKEGHIGNAYMECIWSMSSSSWTQNPLYLSIQADKLNNNVPKFTDWPLVFPGFTDEELVACDGNCVGMRDENKTDNECVSSKTCIITLVVKLSEGKYLFSVRSALTFGVWTSVSLSAKESSNEKLGFDCTIKGEVDAKPSGEVTTTNKDEKGSKAVKILDAKLTDDGPRRMTCEFEVEKPITFPGGEEGTTLDLEQNEAFITIAFGRFSGQKEKAKQSVSLKTSFKFNDDDGQAERTFLVILSLTFVALFVVSTLSVIGLGFYLYHPKKRKGVKVKQGAKRKSLKIKSRKSSPVGSKIDKGSPTSNI